MALDAELLGLKSAGTYRFERDLSTISNDTTAYSNLRLVVGFSKVGPFNTVNLVTNSSEFIKLYGNIDRTLEKKGSYFHRSALVALDAGPILCLNLLNLDPDKDQVQEKSFSTNFKKSNNYTITIPLNSVFNTDKLWYASDESFIDAINKYLCNASFSTMEVADEKNNYSNGILHFTNIFKNPVSILVKKASPYNTKGYEVTLNDWYGKGNVPEYLNPSSFVSDYMVEVYVVGGDFGPEMKESKVTTTIDMNSNGEYETLTKYTPITVDTDGSPANPYRKLTSDIIYQSYFDENGFIRKFNPEDKTDTRLTQFLNLPSVNLIAKYVGSLIPDFIDKFGRNLWIQKLVNDDIGTVGLLCAEDVNKIEDVEISKDGVVNEAIDIIGHNIYNYYVNSSYKDSPENIDILSYRINRDMLFPQQMTICFDSDVSFTVNGAINTTRADSDWEWEVDNYSYYVRCREKDVYNESQNYYAWCKVNYYIDNDGGAELDKDSLIYTKQSRIKESTPGFGNYNGVSLYKKISSKTFMLLQGSFNTPIYRVFNVETLPFIPGTKSVIGDNNLIQYKTFDNLESKHFYNGNTIESGEYIPKENEAIINADENIRNGDYLVSYWTGVEENTDSGISSFSRLTRVVKILKVYDINENGKYTEYKRVICSDKIWRTGQSITNDYINRVIPIDESCDRLHWTCLKGFQLRENSIPNGTNERQNEILDMLREEPINKSVRTNLYKTLIDRDYIQWRYLVDTFGLGLEEECKSVYTKLCKGRASAFAIINCPSQHDFKVSDDPSFVNSNGSVDVEYIASGGNMSLNPRFLFSLPSIENGASWGAYYYPYLRISDLSAVKSVPPAAYVSNLYIQKYNRAHAWSIVAGQKRGVISGNQVIGVETTLIHDNRDWLEPAGINPIIWENGVGVEVYANKTAKHSPKSALSSAHVRECCIYIQDNIENILRKYIFEYNTAQTRLEIKTLVDEFLESVKNNSGVYDYKTVMDTSNNTNEVIDNNMGVIDVYIEPVRGLEILAQRLTVMKTGGIAASGSFE